MPVQTVKPPHHGARPEPEPSAGFAPLSRRRQLGELIGRPLSDEQIKRILAFQQARGLRFGEAAVALQIVERKDVLEALSRQFQYTTGFAKRAADSELVMAADPFSEQADAFRELRSRLLLEVLQDVPRCALAVVSAEVGDGKSYLASNLAVALSQLGERTLLVDADLRTPRQHRLLGLPQGPGLSTVLAGYVRAGEAVHPVPELPHLYLLPAGAVPPNPLELLQRPAFTALLHDMVQSFEHLVLDTPAASRGADCRVISSRCGGAIVVARKGRGRIGPLEGLLASLSRSPVRMAGVVMNEH